MRRRRAGVLLERQGGTGILGAGLLAVRVYSAFATHSLWYLPFFTRTPHFSTFGYTLRGPLRCWRRVWLAWVSTILRACYATSAARITQWCGWRVVLRLAVHAGGAARLFTFLTYSGAWAGWLKA
jgi:hypothetical protein